MEVQAATHPTTMAERYGFGGVTSQEAAPTAAAPPPHTTLGGTAMTTTNEYHYMINSCQALACFEGSTSSNEFNYIKYPDGAMAPTTPYESSFSTSSIVHTTTWQEQAIFFGAGLGSSVCYIATLSSLVHFKLLYGPDSFVYLNLAVYFPLVPISLAQALLDQYFDTRYTSERTFLFRGTVGFVLGLLGTLLMIHGDGNPNSGLQDLVLHAGIQGTGGAILYGTMNQLASFVGGDGGPKLKAAYSAGVQASALVVLSASFVTGFGTHGADKFGTFLWSIAYIEFLCLAIFIRLLLVLPTVTEAMIRRDSTLHPEEDPVVMMVDKQANLLVGIPLLLASGQQYYPPTMQLSYLQLIRQSLPCCSVLAVTLIPSFLVGSWFTRVQTDWIDLASWLFYIRIGCDFLGRLGTVVIPPMSTHCLSFTALLRLLPVAVFFVNAHRPSSYADVVSIVLVVVISFLSGYLVTASYQLAPMGMDWQVRQANAAKQASLLTVAFSFSALGGLLSSFLLMAMGV